MQSKVIRLYENDFFKIEEFLSKNFSSPTHWPDWNQIITKIFKTDFFYFAFVKEGNIVGICPIHKIKKRLIYKLISGPKIFGIPFGGWIFSEKINFNINDIILRKNESLEILSLPLIKEFNTNYCNYSIYKQYETAIIELDKSEDDILNSFTTQKRYKIRKAIKNKVEICGIDDIGFEKFYNFYEITNKRYGLENLPRDYFWELKNNTLNVKFHFLVAMQNSKLLGQLILVTDKNYAIIWIGSRIDKGPNNGYFDLLHWELIKKSKLLGCKYYDACYLEKDRLPNIYKFKIGYTKNLYPVLNIFKRNITFRVINQIQKIF